MSEEARTAKWANLRTNGRPRGATGFVDNVEPLLFSEEVPDRYLRVGKKCDRSMSETLYRGDSCKEMRRDLADSERTNKIDRDSGVEYPQASCDQAIGCPI